MRLTDDLVHEQAIAWHLRLTEDGFDEWDGFVSWLEADAAHNSAYEAVSDADAGLGELAAPAPSVATHPVSWPAVWSANDEPDSAPVQRRPGRLMAMAATVALVAIGSWVGFGAMNQTYEVRTAPGETRTLALADGTRIALNGSTEIMLDRRDPRFAELKSGEAKFSVHHDAADPFELTVADQKIVDVGTVFNVKKSPQSLKVEVAEGAVRYEDGQVRMRLDAGDTLQASGANVVEGTRPPEAIGSWTNGRLVYEGAPLVEVAGDLARARGIAVELAPNLAQETFSGVIQLDGDGDTLRQRVAQLLRLKVSKTSDGWSISR